MEISFSIKRERVKSLTGAMEGDRSSTMALSTLSLPVGALLRDDAGGPIRPNCDHVVDELSLELRLRIGRRCCSVVGVGVVRDVVSDPTSPLSKGGGITRIGCSGLASGID